MQCRETRGAEDAVPGDSRSWRCSAGRLEELKMQCQKTRGAEDAVPGDSRLQVCCIFRALVYIGTWHYGISTKYLIKQRFKSIDVNRTFPSINRRSSKIILTVPLNLIPGYIKRRGNPLFRIPRRSCSSDNTTLEEGWLLNKYFSNMYNTMYIYCTITCTFSA